MHGNHVNFKKIYDETASVIMDLCLKKKLSEPEMYFLLNLLERIWLKNNDDPFVKALELWQKNRNSEIDEIIKETLLLVDFKSNQSINNVINLIEELISSQMN